MKYIILLTLMYTLLINSALAGSSSGKVQHLMVHLGDVAIFTAGAHNNKPTCSTAGDGWAISLKTDKGRAMYAMLLSAAAQGQTVNVSGEDACNAWGDRESPLLMYINF